VLSRETAAPWARNIRQEIRRNGSRHIHAPSRPWPDKGNAEPQRDFFKKIGSNFQMTDKSLAVEFRKPWNLLAEFNSCRPTQLAAGGENYEKENWRREGDSNPTVLSVNKGESHGDSRIDSRNSILSCPDLTQVVTAWAKLSAPIKAAILALVRTAS
jgi:hypothetical protein